jgi:hypothetical protein
MFVGGGLVPFLPRACWQFSSLDRALGALTSVHVCITLFK